MSTLIATGTPVEPHELGETVLVGYFVDGCRIVVEGEIVGLNAAGIGLIDSRGEGHVIAYSTLAHLAHPTHR